MRRKHYALGAVILTVGAATMVLLSKAQNGGLSGLAYLPGGMQQPFSAAPTTPVTVEAPAMPESQPEVTVAEVPTSALVEAPVVVALAHITPPGPEIPTATNESHDTPFVWHGSAGNGQSWKGTGGSSANSDNSTSSGGGGGGSGGGGGGGGGDSGGSGKPTVLTNDNPPGGNPPAPSKDEPIIVATDTPTGDKTPGGGGGDSGGSGKPTVLTNDNPPGGNPPAPSKDDPIIGTTDTPTGDKTPDDGGSSGDTGPIGEGDPSSVVPSDTDYAGGDPDPINGPASFASFVPEQETVSVDEPGPLSLLLVGALGLLVARRSAKRNAA